MNAIPHRVPHEYVLHRGAGRLVGLDEGDWARIAFYVERSALLKTAVPEFQTAPYSVKIAGIFFSLLMAAELALRS